MATKTKIDPANVHVRKDSDDRIVVSYRTDEARYHYWTADAVALVPGGAHGEGVLFKNPPEGVNRPSDAGYFKCRHLKIENNKTMVEEMRRVGVTMLADADREMIEREAKRTEEETARGIAHVIGVVKGYAAWNLRMPLDLLSDKEVASALDRMIGELAVKKESAA